MSEENGDIYAPITYSEEDLTPIEIPVTLGDKRFVLREATGDAAVRYRNASIDGVTLGPNGKPQKIEGAADTEPLLVSLCLYAYIKPRGGADGQEVLSPKSVNESFVRGLHNRVMKQLFERAKKISELEDAEQTEESIQKQIDDLQEKLEELRAGSAAKNEPSD